MVRESEVRAGERVVDPPAADDAAFIGRIRTPWTSIAPPQPGDFHVGDEGEQLG